MQAIQPVAAIGNTSSDTTNSLSSEPARVCDVTAEILGERREEWRAGFDSGLRDGARRVLQSDALSQMSLSLQGRRAVAEAAMDAGVQQERLAQLWKAEAKWWREEHDRVHAEYYAFVAEAARRFCK